MATVLVTGANRGIGFELTRQYAGDGARVIACARRPDDAKDLQAIASASGGRVVLHELDVTDAGSIAALARELDGHPVDILINNAGVYGGDHQRLGDIDYEAWARTLAANTLAPVRITEALRANLINGREKKVIAISSMMGSTARHDGGALIYRSSKAALNNAMKGLSAALNPDRIVVAILHPGWVRTDMGGANATLSPEASVTGMRKVIAGLTAADSGRFLNHDGSEIPW
jgi:NAD(P)-dependent dehydrogenase (short-subunit alcohol dehydrogenase family)